MILDTCFLIDLQREFKKGEPGRATAFLKAHPDAGFSISVISVTEFLEGFADITEGEPLLRAYKRLSVDSKVASRAAGIRRSLRLAGQLIGDFDILIAATALVEELPLVTQNLNEFGRVDELEVLSY